MKLYAWIGPDEWGSGKVGLKQGLVPSGHIAAFWQRSEANGMREDPVDNATLPAGSPLFFRCDACHCDIIVQEGYLTRPRLCYDCRDLKDAGLLFEMQPPHTGWNLKRD